MKCLDRAFTMLVGGLLLLVPLANAQSQTKPDLSKIPPKVMGALKARFPKAEIHTWTVEKEGDITVHDIEFRQGRRKFEADIRDDGAIHNWEQQISVRELPSAVRKSVETKYPRPTLNEVMAITAVRDGKDVPEGYEILLRTKDKKEVEVSVAPDGKFLEDSGEKK